MRIVKMLAVIAALGAGVPASAQQVSVDPSFLTHNFGWSGNGSTTVIWRPMIIEGKIAICGAYASRGGRKYADLSRQAIRDMRIETANGVFLRGLGFFSRATARDLQPGASATANCRVTNVAGQPAQLQGLRLGFTPQNYRFD